DTADGRELVDRQVVAVGVRRPGEALDQRLIRRAEAALHRRRRVHLVVADFAVAVDVEVDERRAANVTARVDDVLREAVQQRAGRRRALKVDAGLEREAPDEVVDAERGLDQLLSDVDLTGERAGILEQTVHVVAALLLVERERASDPEGDLAAVVRARNGAEEALRLEQVAAVTRAACLRHHVRVAADLARSEDRRGRTFDHLDLVHGREHAAPVALEVQALHASEVGVRRNVADVDRALYAEASRRVDARHYAHEILDGGKPEQIDRLLADGRYRSRRLEQWLAEAEGRSGRLVRQQAPRIVRYDDVAEIRD